MRFWPRPSTSARKTGTHRKRGPIQGWLRRRASAQGRAGAVLAVVAALVASMVVWATGANAAGGLLSVSLTAIDASVDAGDALSYSLNQQCSNPAGCSTVTSVIPAPAAWTPAFGAPVVNLTPGQIAAGVSASAGANGTISVVWPNANAGTSLNVQLNWPTQNYLTVPGAQTATVTSTDTAPTPDTASATANNTLTAVPNLAQTKSGSVSAVVGGNVSYLLKTSNVQTNPTTAQGGLSLTNVVITDVLPPGVTNVVPDGNGVYDAATNTVTWPPLPSLGGVGGPNEDTNGAVANGVSYTLPANADPSFTDHATATGTPLGGGSNVTATSQFTTNINVGPPTVVPHVYKSGPSDLTPGELVYYGVTSGNDGTAIADSTLIDAIPAVLDVQAIWFGPNDASYTGPATYDVTYSDGTVATFTALVGAYLDVSKAGVRVTNLQVNLPSLNPAQVPSINYRALVNNTAVTGSTVTNCATENITAPGATPATAQYCTSAPVKALLSTGSLQKSLAETTPVAIGQTLHWNLQVDGDSSGNWITPLQPKIVDLIPSQLTYVNGSFALAAGQPAGCPTASQYTVTVTPNYINGRTGLVAVAPSGVVIGEGVDCQYQYQTTINAATPAGAYTGSTGQTTTGPTVPIPAAYAGNDSYLLDTRGILDVSGVAINTADIGKDGFTDEGVGSATADFQVAQSAALHVTKQVEGDQDSAFLGSAEQDPTQVGTSTVGGTVQYKVSLGNDGNQPETNLVAYDLLPTPDNHGVTVSRYSDTSDVNEWTPTLTGPISTGSDPVTVYYSTNADPCRPEMDNTHAESFYCGGNFNANSDWVTAANVADWSQIRAVRFDYGTTLVAAGSAFTYTWTMNVPATKNGGATFVGGEKTWNKIAVQGTSDVNGTLTPLLPTEAPWVVDKVALPAIVASVSVGDFVWADTNGNGIQDGGEPGIAGVVLNLTGPTGQPVTDTNGQPVTAQTTDANGAYDFTNLPVLPAGQHYTVTIDAAASATALSGYVPTLTGQGTTATDSSTGSATSTDLTTDGASDPTLDFGYVKPVSVGDFVWKDTNKDGIQTTAEPGIAGVVLTITDAAGHPVTDLAGNPVGPQTTDTNGAYEFTNLPPGQYITHIDTAASATALTGLVPTITGQGTTATDSSTGSATSAVLPSGGSDQTLDYGYVGAPSVSVGDFVWADTNGNGIQDAGEPGIAGVVLNLTGPTGQPVTDINGVPLAPQTTDTNGAYHFTNLPVLPAGQHYTVTIDAAASTGPLTGYVPTLTGQGTTATDSSTGSATSTDLTTDGSSDPTLDFGYVKPVKVGDFVWKDTNGDGIQTPGEPGIDGVVITITDAAGHPVTDLNGNPVGPQTTDTNGFYEFTDLPPGQYITHIDTAASATALTGLVPTITGQGTTATDSSTGSATSAVLAGGDEDETLDYGFVAAEVSVGDFVWADTNGNGIQDAGEPGIAGVVLTLTGPTGQPVTDVDGNPVTAVTTDGDGAYEFEGLPVLPAGQHYTVTIDAAASATALNGYAPTLTGKGTTATDSSTGSATSTDLTTDGAQDLTLDFGFIKLETGPTTGPTPTPTPAAPTPASTGGGGLAFTGFDSAVFAAAGLLLLAFGAALMITGRRRQH